MLMNKEQATQTWCPMVRVAVVKMFDYGGDEARDHRLDRPPAAACVAEKCAMWRWVDKPAPERDGDIYWPLEDYPKSEPERPSKVPADAVWMPLTGEGDDIEGGFWVENPETVDAENATAAAERRGYCGLAGRPA